MSTEESAISARELEVPELSLVVLVGAVRVGEVDVRSDSGSCRRRFCRLISAERWSADDENDQSATKDAFEILHFIAGKRMAGGRLTVVDATNVKREDRAKLVALAREYHFLACRDRVRLARAPVSGPQPRSA